MTKMPKCSCTNHMGTKKMRYRSRDEALEVILRDYLEAGTAYSVYECPTSGLFHITSNVRAVERR